MRTTIASMLRKARLTHICSKCHGTISIGKNYEYTFSVEDGASITEVTCMVCVNNRTPIHCGDDMGWSDELRRQTKAEAEKWEAGQ